MRTSELVWMGETNKFDVSIYSTGAKHKVVIERHEGGVVQKKYFWSRQDAIAWAEEFIRLEPK